MTGYYLMHRGWMDNPVFGKGSHREAFDQRSAWVWLIEHAQYEPAQVRISGKMVELQRGQLSHSYRYLGRAWGWPEVTARRFCATLASVNMISCATDAGQVVITVSNYDKYQIEPRDGGAANGASVAQNRRRTGADIKEGKEEGSDPDGSGADAPADPVKELWDRGLAILGVKNRSLLGGLVKKFDKVAVLAAIIETEREQPVDPVAYLIACCKRSMNGQQRALDILAQAAIDHDDRQDGGGPVETAH